MTDLQINCFLEVANCLSFTQAAKKIFISQSNISRQISSLEAELGLALFDRNTKGVKLTPQGELLKESLTDLKAEWKEAKERAKNISKKHSTIISVGCQENVNANSYFANLLYEFSLTHPDIVLLKERAVQSRLVEGLLNDYYDCILSVEHNLKTLKNITKETLYYPEIGIVLHKNHPLYKKKNVSIKDLKDYPILRYEPFEMSLDDDYVVSMCRDAGFEPKIHSSIEDFNKFLFAIEMGEACALIIEEAEAKANPNLRIIPIPKDVSKDYLPMQLVKKSNSSSEALSEFFEFAKAYSASH